MIEVLVVLDIEEILCKQEFEEYILKEGFESVDNEPFAYIGKSDTPFFNTKAYIFEVFSKAFEAAKLDKCKMICQISSNAPEVYLYTKEKFFTELK
ncbi:MAG: hypothetical protein LBP40_05320 [Campylobacteraceae bacterium]|nr:hypothetical protein [Campylobacteraceae bacterium]